MRAAGGKNRLAKILAALDRLYGTRDAEAFPHVMMSVADELVPCLNLSFDTVDLRTGAATDFFDRPIPLSHAEFMARWRVLCHEHPGIAFLEKGGQASVFAVTDFLSQRQFRNTAMYHEVFKACGGGYQIGVILPVPGFVVGMAMNRDKDFTASEREFIELLHPHFVRAFEHAQLFTSLRDKPAVDYHAWRNRGLTRRECEVLQWLAEGKRNAEITVILGAQPRTIGKHVENIFAKLHVETRAAAAAEARRMLPSQFPAAFFENAPHLPR